MNKFFTTILILLISSLTWAQTGNNTYVYIEKIKKDSVYNFNTWSVELNVGTNKAIRPFAKGYSASGDNRFFNFTGFNHFDIGVRKMLNTKFGFKFDFGSDIIESQEGKTDSKPYHSTQYKIAFQGVFNISRLLGFETFAKRIGLLLHGGPQAARFYGKTPIYKKFSTTEIIGYKKNNPEYNGGYMLGLTPQYRITDRLVATGDFSVMANSRQHYNWDGSYSNDETNLSGVMNTISLGLTYYFGKNQKHADWFVANSNCCDQVNEYKNIVIDTDKDGVIDDLDLQKDTPKDVAVDSRGRFIDLNKNNIPDELEPIVDPADKIKIEKATQSESILDIGFVNVYYDVNKELPNSGSINNVYYVIKYLKTYPSAKVLLSGYADVNGIEAKNINLSINRAENLKKVIISNGIDASRIATEGKGVDKASKVNDDVSLQFGRRVSITLQ
ncbi:OmpA family protein [Flavobacterium sp.]|uniref:OmpA family protein n=1 Tax=Flavobacterium sp. TaxID=239 RepID=UPI0038FC2589